MGDRANRSFGYCSAVSRSSPFMKQDRLLTNTQNDNLISAEPREPRVTSAIMHTRLLYHSFVELIEQASSINKLGSQKKEKFLSAAFKFFDSRIEIDAFNEGIENMCVHLRDLEEIFDDV